MAICVQCPSCDKSLTANDALAGKRVKCPSCGQAIPVHLNEPQPLPTPAASGSRLPWLLLIGCGGTGLALAAGLGVVALVLFVFVLPARNSKPGAVEVANNSPEPKPEPKSSTPAPDNPGGPKGGQPPSGTNPKPDPRDGQPTQPAPQPKPRPSRVLVESPDGLELPPIGPSAKPANDTIAQDYKTARAAYQEARKKARADLLAQYPKVRDEVQKSNLDAKEKTVLLQELETQQMAFAYGPGKSSGSGPLHTHILMQPAVADYWKALATATQKFGEAAEKGLAAYEKGGVTDPMKLRPLLAAKLAGQHTDLLGVWATDNKGEYDVWIIDVDEATGGWQVDGVLTYSKGHTGLIFHGENIEFKDGTLAFVASPVDTKTRKVGPGGTPVTLKLQTDKIVYQTRVGVKPIAKVMVRTGEEAARANVDYWGVQKAPPAGADALAEKPDPNDANYVWHRIAGFLSFQYYQGGHGPFGGERLYVPFRSKQPPVSSGGPYGPLVDMLAGRAPGQDVNQGLAEAIFKEFDQLGESPSPYLKRAAGLGLTLCKARIQLAEADQLFGNTPASSVREFQQKVFIPTGQYVFQREVDRAELEDALRKQHPDLDIVVVDAPLSDESRQKLNAVLKNVAGMEEELKNRAKVSGFLAYADMAQVDRTAAFWQTWLLPLAKRCGGPASDKPLVAVEGDWKPRANKQERFQRLSEFRLRNVAGQDLTHAVVELIAENEWGEKAAHYYYFQQLEGAATARLVPQPRWDKRRLDFTNTINVTWSVWADQGSEVGRQVKLTSPQPNPDPAGWRKDYLGFDKQFQAEGEALGAVARNMHFLPVNPERQRRRLLAVAAPGTTYAVQFADKGKAGQTLVVRFLRLDVDKIEAEVFDLAERKPFRPDTPVWKGKLTADKEDGYILRMEAGWTLRIAPDDQANVVLPAADKPTREVPLVRIKLP